MLDRVYHVLDLLVLVLCQDGEVVSCKVDDVFEIGALSIDAQEELLVAAHADGLLLALRGFVLDISELEVVHRYLRIELAGVHVRSRAILLRQVLGTVGGGGLFFRHLALDEVVYDEWVLWLNSHIVLWQKSLMGHRSILPLPERLVELWVVHTIGAVFWRRHVQQVE